MRTEAGQLEKQRGTAVLRLEQTLARLRVENAAPRDRRGQTSRGASPGKQGSSTENQAAVLSAQATSLRQEIEEIDQRRRKLLRELRQREMQQAAATGAMVALRVAGGVTPSDPSLMHRLSAAGGGSPYDQYLLLPLWGEADGVSSYSVETARQQVAAAELDLRAAEAAVANKKQMVQQGLAPPSELTPVQAEYARAQGAVEDRKSALDLAQKALGKREQIERLQRPIDVDMREASVRQAALAMSQAAGMGIEVEASVPADTRLTVVAWGVPLASVLDAIARQSGLMIAPKEDGVVLKPSPSLEVNGQRTRFMSPYAPWSSEWGINPALVSGRTGSFSRDSIGYPSTVPLSNRPTGALTPAPEGRGAKDTGSAGQAAPSQSLTPSAGQFQPPATASEAASGLNQAVPSLRSSQRSDSTLRPVTPRAAPPEARDWLLVPRQYAQNVPGYYRFAVAGPAPVAISSIGENAVVVAHPDSTPEGEPAVKLTVYRLDGGRLREVTTTLHRLPREAARPGGLSLPARGSVPSSMPGKIRSAPVAPPVAR
jgi:hypothetical protein